MPADIRIGLWTRGKRFEHKAFLTEHLANEDKLTILAECGIEHEHVVNSSECPVASRWTIVRSP